MGDGLSCVASQQRGGFPVAVIRTTENRESVSHPAPRYMWQPMARVSISSWTSVNDFHDFPAILENISKHAVKHSDRLAMAGPLSAQSSLDQAHRVGL